MHRDAGKDKVKRKAKGGRGGDAGAAGAAQAPTSSSAASGLLDRRGVNRVGASSLLPLLLPERLTESAANQLTKSQRRHAKRAVDEAVRAINCSVEWTAAQGRCTAAMSPRFGEPRSSILRRSSAWRKRFSGGLRQFARPMTQRLFARC